MNIKFFDILLNFVFVQCCSNCNRILDYDESFICSDCLKKGLIPIHYINVYNRLFFIDDAYILFYYTDIIKRLIHAVKFYKDFSAIKLMKFLLDKYIIIDRLPDFDIIIPVPLFPSRKRMRGYNQSYIIGKRVAKLVKKRIYDNILIRQKNTTPQSLLTLEDRKHNIREAFFVKECNKSYISGKRILLVDDIFTTGFTTNECARVLKKSGAKEVFIFALATSEI